MKFLQKSRDEIKADLNSCSYQELLEFTKYIDDVMDDDFSIRKIHSIQKIILVNRLSIILSTSLLVEKIYHKLSSTDASKFVYENLVWETNTLETVDVMKKFSITFLSEKSHWDGITEQKDEFLFIQREEQDNYRGFIDRLALRGNFKSILKMIFPVPAELKLFGVIDKERLNSYLEYSNEEHIFSFISTISDMLKNNLIEFGKTNEKPLSKTLTMLKSTTTIEEFYEDKKLSLLATDMLTRSFSYYYWQIKGFKTKELDVLRNFVALQFEDKINFFITRTFLTHLKKVRYDSWYTKQASLFSTLKLIIKEMPKESWVDMGNIIKFCRYQDIRIDLDRANKTKEYYIDAEIITDSGAAVEQRFYTDDNNYQALFLEPILKASLFYLGALGLFELKYDEPYSPYSVKAKGKPYISPWDSLEFVKLNKLGEYIFGLRDSYEQKTIVKKTTTLKFDEYKPIITVDEKDTLSLAKLDSYCDKYDKNRYILSYAKIFKDCKNSKALELKIEHFYKNIELNPPKVFQNFFDEIKENRNALKRDLKQVVIELNNNKKLLHLFMQNKKLQELIIKAQGYRVIVLKENIPKLTKIVKEHGFFIEF